VARHTTHLCAEPGCTVKLYDGYGLNAGIINTTQFSLLVTVVVLSAVVPTAVAERWFLPDADREQRVDRRLAALRSEKYV
jgi:hypothetical protein